MPLYEYRCRDCGEEFETLVSLRKRDEEVPCPACGQRQGERLVSVFSSRSGSSCSGPAPSGGFSRPAPSGGCGNPSGFS